MSTSAPGEAFISRLLHPDVQRFIRLHESDDVHALSLRYDTVAGIPFPRIAEQIAGRRKARLKLPRYFEADGILYPPSANLEQCSSERTARFKVALLAEGGLPAFRRCTDLTGGFGVDSLYFSSIFQSLHFVEPDSHLLSIARHNHNRLGATNISYYGTDAATFLHKNEMEFDLIYLDPSRRREQAGRVIELTSYAPDIREIMPPALLLTRHMLLKASPMLDIQRGLSVVPHVRKVIAVAVENEVRELLFLSDSRHTGEPLLEAVNLAGEKVHTFSFYRRDEQQSTVRYGDPQRYLYEPYLSVMKVGAFNAVANRFGLLKLHRNTHLYTSDALIGDFPGRIFRVEAVSGRISPALMRSFPEGRANIMVRNYPLGADDLRSRTGLRDGGSRYLLGFTSPRGKMLAAASRVH